MGEKQKSFSEKEREKERAAMIITPQAYGKECLRDTPGLSL